MMSLSYYKVDRFLRVPYTKKIKYFFINNFLSEEEIKSHPTLSKDHFDLWYESDKAYFERAPKINLQGTADLVIIDGGEYCGFSDYEQSLLLKPTYLYLDDIRTQKTDKKDNPRDNKR